MANTSLKAKLIYNPHAGQKRNIFSLFRGKLTALEDIKSLLNQYQIPVDYYPTKAPGHATELAQAAEKEGYKLVIVAGGDGTAGEAANGLVGSNIPLGILPLGSVMNIARMLSIPFDLEKAVMLLKVGHTRKIDVGMITKMGEEDLSSNPYFFLESVGIGLEAQMHEHVLQLERGNWREIFKIFHTIFDYYGHAGKIILDGKVHKTNATLVTFSNGPFSGAALPLAPTAKLNDHRLTIRFYKMTKLELIEYFLVVMFGAESKIIRKLKLRKRFAPKIETYQAKEVEVKSKVKRVVHADARVYGTIPIKMSIRPNSLNVITGFIKPGDMPILKKRTLMDP